MRMINKIPPHLFAIQVKEEATKVKTHLLTVQFFGVKTTKKEVEPREISMMSSQKIQGGVYHLDLGVLMNKAEIASDLYGDDDEAP